MNAIRIAAIVTVTVTAVAAFLGSAGAGKALAEESPSFTRLCLDNSNGEGGCLTDTGIDENVQIASKGIAITNYSEWEYPNVNGSSGYIEAYEGGCLQVNASDGYTVRNAECVSDAAEKWTNVYHSSDGRTVFESDYNGDLCLTEDYSDNRFLKAESCPGTNVPWYQAFGAS